MDDTTLAQELKAVLEEAGYEVNVDVLLRAIPLLRDAARAAEPNGDGLVHADLAARLTPIGERIVAMSFNGELISLEATYRVVEAFARRFQVQEKMTAQIANCINHVLQPKGVGVVIEARHLCMMMRGVEKQNSMMTTSMMLGSFRDHDRTRAEFLKLVAA